MENEENGTASLTPVLGQDLISIEDSDDFLALAEKRVDTLQKIKGLALKITASTDWIDQGGKPYLQVSGSEKIARLFGVSIKDVKQKKEKSSDEKGDFFFYLVEGVASLRGGDSLVAIGTCSSRDNFFAKKSGEWLPASQVDETNLLKAAYTNFLGNAITRLLGLRNLTWEEVEKFANFKRSHVAGVKYQNNATDSSGNLFVTGAIEDIQIKNGVNAKNIPWVLYSVFLGGKKYFSFSGSIGKKAQEFFDKGITATLTYKQGERGLTLIDAAPAQSTKETELEGVAL